MLYCPGIEAEIVMSNLMIQGMSLDCQKLSSSDILSTFVARVQLVADRKGQSTVAMWVTLLMINQHSTAILKCLSSCALSLGVIKDVV